MNYAEGLHFSAFHFFSKWVLAFLRGTHNPDSTVCNSRLGDLVFVQIADLAHSVCTSMNYIVIQAWSHVSGKVYYSTENT